MDMETYGRIGIIILWSLMSLLVFIQYAPAAKELSIGDKIIFIIICLIGGPIFTAANILETMLNCILPEGWDEE